ncbi:MAG: hypothetical protein ABJH45_10325 [Paracoccaceae bacterium]
MTDDSQQVKHTSLGIYDRPQANGVTGVEVVALAMSLLWIVLTALYFFFGSSADDADGLRVIVTLMAVFLPVAMIWVAAMAARSTRVMREESARLQSAIDAIRQTYIAQSQGHDIASETSVVRKHDEIAATAKGTKTELATFQSKRTEQNVTPAPTPTPAPAPSLIEEMEQPALALDTQVQEPALEMSHKEMIRALNFPETAEDGEGFVALRRAMKDRNVAQLVTASQDILTLLSQDGIYMDDLHPDRARPEIWRQFANGARGRPIADLGGVREKSPLALSADRMKQDPIFRDTAHHFLRRFDRLFSKFAETASDEDISMMADTRTARAFMLLGRVAGTFD